MSKFLLFDLLRIIFDQNLSNGINHDSIISL